MFSWIPSFTDVVAAAPTLLSLVAIEGLLSVDNLLVIAAKVKTLDPAKRKRATRLSMVGAYVCRMLALLGAAILIQHPWIKLMGGAFLLYLMCEHLGRGSDGEASQEALANKKIGTSFGAIVVSLTITNVAFSIDNVVAAVALSPHLWVVILGVSIGMLTMTFVSGVFSKLLDRFPVLENLAYVLVGYVGLQIFLDFFFHMEVSELQKFAVIASILIAGMVYDKATFLHPVLGPVLGWLAEIMDDLAELVNTLAKPLVWLMRCIQEIFTGR
jgi:tellurite resistance protein TerC